MMRWTGKRIIWTAALLLLGAVLLLSVAFAEGRRERFEEETFFAMDTVITIKVPAKDKQVLPECRKLVEELEEAFSRTIPESDISRLNEGGKLGISELSADTVSLLNRSLELAVETGGAFDPTLGQLSKLWNIGAEEPVVPDNRAVSEALEHTGYENLRISGQEVILQNGIELDLGGIAKGYAADLLKDELNRRGVEDALLILGGNVYAMGDNRSSPWKIGVSDPADSSRIMGTVSVSDCSVVTSGDYQRYFEQDGRRYHHIFNPETGVPAENNLSSVTVLHRESAAADAYSTALFVMGLQKGIQFAAEREEMGVIFVTKDNKVYTAGKLAESFLLKSEQYQYETQN